MEGQRNCTMGNGYWQKILRVDLSTSDVSVEPIDEEDLKKYLGGAGLGAEILRRELPAKLDAYDGRNRVIFATGPFQGPPVPGGAKFSIVGISPVTGTFADTAAGASWGPSLKDAGYDALIVQGRSDKPVYIKIVDDAVEIKDAAHLVGKDSYDTVDAIHAENEDNKLSVACIGPAGERQVAIACVAVDKHSFGGRCGLGAVMGSKNLKAVAVRGTGNVPVANPEKTRKLVKAYFKKIHDTTVENEFRRHGTPVLCETAEGLGDMPIQYWHGDIFHEGAKKLGAPNYTEVLNAKPLPCKYCPIGCHRDIEVTSPPEYQISGPGPEYETLGMMGTNCMIDDPKAVAKANDIANRLGVDSISVGAMVGFAMHCREKGWLTDEQTAGYDLSWGSGPALIRLTEDIAQAKGLGELFKDGTLAAARRIGPDAVEAAVHNKGLDYPAHDPRACHSLAPTYATGTRGACHFRGPCEDIEMGGFYMPEVGIKEGTVKFFELDNQSLVAARCQDLGVVVNSIVICMFMVDGGGLSLTETVELFNAITGWDFSVKELLKTGERGFTVQRLINLRDGYGTETDVLPKQMYQSAKEGFRAGKQIPFEELMKEYYGIRGWDEAGVPTAKTLEMLDLKT
ncbi:MAG: aldehyde ferredoxin oxidoreductase family protein [Phycisphaerales bacterium]|nr:MAG: aldehyde ferredoxin oxidoreductase family protein [Phycisphaerales bacterium]